MGDSFQITRVGLSVPCSVPVKPGTPDTDGELSERTETCNVDAWWFVGALPICDMHLRVLLPMAGDDYESVAEEFRKKGWTVPDDKETQPWAEMRRYPQEPAEMQPSLFNRARYRNPNRCQLRPHYGRKVTHRVTLRTRNPRSPETSFGVCGECARKWERVEGAKVTPIPTNDEKETA